jgi:hypothetical protein
MESRSLGWKDSDPFPAFIGLALLFGTLAIKKGPTHIALPVPFSQRRNVSCMVILPDPVDALTYNHWKKKSAKPGVPFRVDGCVRDLLEPFAIMSSHTVRCARPFKATTFKKPVSNTPCQCLALPTLLVGPLLGHHSNRPCKKQGQHCSDFRLRCHR